MVVVSCGARCRVAVVLLCVFRDVSTTAFDEAEVPRCVSLPEDGSPCSSAGLGLHGQVTRHGDVTVVATEDPPFPSCAYDALLCCASEATVC